MHGYRDAPGHRSRVFCGTNCNAGAGPGNLPEGYVYLGIIFAKTAAPDSVIDTDDLPFDRGAEFGDAWNQLFDYDALLERILPFQITFDELLVHDGDLHARSIVLIGKKAPLDEAYSEGLEEVRCNHPEARTRPLRGVVERGLTSDGEGHTEASAIEWHPRHRCDMGDAGNRLYAGQNLAIVGDDRLCLFGPRLWNGESESEDVVGADSEVDACEIDEAVNRQARSGEQCQCEGKLARHEGTAQPMAPDAGACAAALFERFPRIYARGIPCGNASDD
jgi:hypothetical protein